MKKEKFLGIITKDVIVANEETPAVDIARLMENDDIGVVVILRDEKVTGIVSERDIARRVVAKNLSPETTKAKDFMTRDLVTVDFKEGLNKIYQTLCEMNFRHLLVMDGDKLVGITCRRDLLDSLIPTEKTLKPKL
ncbi:MAG: CBS domain-containing protein [Candidatus Omnitrophota bacterium]